jgi:hypothetical protein
MELMHKEYRLNKIDRMVGVGLMGTITLASLFYAFTVAIPIAIVAVPTMIAAYAILIGGIESNSKWQYFNAVVSERDSEIKRYKGYPSLYQDEYSKWKSRQHGFNGLKIAQAMLTGTPATFVFDSRTTDEFGGQIDTVVEIAGFRLFVKEKEHQSDIQMWSSAWANAAKLK